MGVHEYLSMDDDSFGGWGRGQIFPVGQPCLCVALHGISQTLKGIRSGARRNELDVDHVGDLDLVNLRSGCP